MVLTTDGDGGTRVYEARVVDGAGRALANASLDISALTSNPDDRVPTTIMKPLPDDPTRYQATVTFPVSGDWVLTVRVHKPIDFVHLGYERVSDTAVPAPSHALTPSRVGLANIAPDFGLRYDPVIGIGGDGSYATVAKIKAANEAGHVTTVDHGTTCVGRVPPGGANRRPDPAGSARRPAFCGGPRLVRRHGGFGAGQSSPGQPPGE